MSVSLQLLPIKKVFADGWQKVSGSKSLYFLGMAIYFVLTIFTVLVMMIKNPIGSVLHAAGLISILLLSFGILCIGINRAFNLSIGIENLFSGFNANNTWRLLGVKIVQAFICFILFMPYAITDGVAKYYAPQNTFFSHVFCVLGFAMCVYFYVRTLLALAFVLHQKLGPLDAIRLSMVATRRNFWRIFLVIVLQNILFLLSILTAGIGLIWTLPYIANIYGETYKNLLINVPAGFYHR